MTGRDIVRPVNSALPLRRRFVNQKTAVETLRLSQVIGLHLVADRAGNTIHGKGFADGRKDLRGAARFGRRKARHRHMAGGAF